MPNWCTNTLELAGPADAVLAIALTLVGGSADDSFAIADAVTAAGPSHAALGDDAARGLRTEFLVNEIRRLGEDLSFNHLVPQPDGLDDDNAPKPLAVPGTQVATKYEVPGWYAWRLENWGCKWNAAQVELLELAVTDTGTARVEWRFDTPWGPPEAWFRALCGRWPDTKAEMLSEEEGMGFLCLARNRDGEVDGDSCDPWDRDDVREFFERIGDPGSAQWYLDHIDEMEAEEAEDDEEEE